MPPMKVLLRSTNEKMGIVAESLSSLKKKGWWLVVVLPTRLVVVALIIMSCQCGSSMLGLAAVTVFTVVVFFAMHFVPQ